MPSARHHLRPFLHDAWAALSHLIGSGTEPVRRDDGLVPTWVDEVDARRLLSYRVLQAYADNVRRYYLPAHMWQADVGTDSGGRVVERGAAPAEGYREYGHARLLVNTARSLLLGHEQSVTVDGARPAAGSEAERVLAWVQAWARREHLEDRVFESEAHTIGMGDGVFTLGWDERTRRPRLRVVDPGMYFPDWAAIDHPDYVDWADEEFPPVVHLAWEVERDDVLYVHRVTWRMEKSQQLRAMAWAPGVPGTPWTCRYRVQEWRVDSLKGQNVYNLPEGQTEPTVDRDLGIDFIPVVHVPNDHNTAHWGTSLLIGVTQVLDDLAGAVTDLNVDSGLVASPPTVFSGVSGVDVEGGPGATYNVGDGAAQILDTSKALDALLKYTDRLEEILSTQARVASVLLGKVDPSKAPSGYAMRLGLAPTDALLSEMARVRVAKHALLLRMAVRLAQAVGPAGGGLAAGENPDLLLHLGTGMPTARQMAIDEALALWDKKAISLETLVGMLVQAGLPIEDVKAEVGRIVAEDTKAAIDVVDATGDVDAARARLQLAVRPGAAPVIVPADPSDPTADPAADPANPANVPAPTS